MNLSPSIDVFTPSQPALETSNDSVLKLIMALRGLDISAESTFDFVLPEGCKEWLAPHYGPYSPHTERPKPGGSLKLRKREATALAKLGVQHPEPLIPQYRPCWKPTLPRSTSTKRRRSHRRVIRRLPPDPPLALVSRQLRHETLSAFYGTNTFVFERAAEPLLASHPAAAAAKTEEEEEEKQGSPTSEPSTSASTPSAARRTPGRRRREK
ncbi:hypothetical protein KC324_g16632 [Hortaea werneckii]|nr:hypothetical protein KC324_g16632 [Hortaea werneckii]